MHDKAFGYDEVPYSSLTFPQTRPDRLATLAAFHGMSPAPPDNCRVLELGCGDGTNLNSFAYILPKSTFLGVDLSNVHVESAKQAASDLRLHNVDFICEDVMDFSESRFGKFDYIIAHGLFSWVPDEVRKKILDVYSRCLAENGVGYISYNAYPGCKTREMLWDMMKFYTSEVRDPLQKVASGIQYLNFLNFAAEQGSAYQTLINAELSLYSQRTVENIYHDDFSTLNKPFYFTEFVEMIKPHGLQFLSEVDAFWTESNLRPEIAAKLDELGDDFLKKEQFADFIKGRPFRSSLICRHQIQLDRDPSSNILDSFFLASQVLPVSQKPDLTTNSVETFEGPEGGKIELDDPLTKSALFILQDRWSRSVSFTELIQAATEASGPASDAEIATMRAALLDLFKKGYVYLHRYSPSFATRAGEMPKASRFVQWQIRRGCSDITALSGMNLKPNGDLMKLLLLLCDGTRNRATLSAELTRRIEFPETERAKGLAEIPEMVDAHLTDFAKLGLLEG